METLVAVSHHRNESYRGKTNQFGSSLPRRFKGLNCRSSSESGGGAGILPSPPRSFSVPAQSTNWQKRSSPIPIARKTAKNRDEGSGSGSPELWAGPTYCNSPPPSSLPIPTFSLRQKRSVSLDLPSETAKEKGVMRPIAKSAPSSPTGSMSPDNGFFLSNAFATQNLRRMLNLDTADD